MRRFLIVPLACALAGCPAPPPAAAPTPAASPTPMAGAVVDPFKVTVSAPADGVVTIAGKPKAVYGAAATLVRIQVVREAPAAWRVLHLGGGLPIAEGVATVDAEGGFAAVRVGDTARAVKVGDEVNLTPYNGSAQAGFPVALKVR